MSVKFFSTVIGLSAGLSAAGAMYGATGAAILSAATGEEYPVLAATQACAAGASVVGAIFGLLIATFTPADNPVNTVANPTNDNDPAITCCALPLMLFVNAAVAGLATLLGHKMLHGEIEPNIIEASAVGSAVFSASAFAFAWLRLRCCDTNSNDSHDRGDDYQLLRAEAGAETLAP